MKTLRSKFILSICALFVLVGVLIFLPLSLILPEKITSQILKRDIKIAQYLSREVQEPLLANNKLAVTFLLEDRSENLGDVIYIYIRGRNGSIISSTFKKEFPKGLLSINPMVQRNGVYGTGNPSGDRYSIKEFLANGKKVYDIAVPLLKGELGSLHVGVSLESSKAEIAEFTKINYYVATVVVMGLGVGIMVFTLFSILLSNRIIKLKDFADRVGNGDLNDRIQINTKDEIGSLAVSFNKMVCNLKEKIEKIKRLTYLEERERIAVEFHDGLAQDLADIIKRSELCEKLFEIKPARAFEELETLRESARDILNKTRQVIFDLKLPQDSDFDLLSNVTNYLKSYQKQNDINVRLDLYGSIDNIPPGKARPIFCIILEALTNIRKHSLAKNVELRIECTINNELVIDIRDDGRGFDMNEVESSASSCGKWGLTTMRQRADSLGGTLLIDSIPNQGTKVSLNIPLADEGKKRS